MIVCDSWVQFTTQIAKVKPKCRHFALTLAKTGLFSTWRFRRLEFSMKILAIVILELSQIDYENTEADEILDILSEHIDSLGEVREGWSLKTEDVFPVAWPPKDADWGD